MSSFKGGIWGRLSLGRSGAPHCLSPQQPSPGGRRTATWACGAGPLLLRQGRARTTSRRGGKRTWRPFQDRTLARPCLSALFPKHSCGRSADRVFTFFHSTQYRHLEVRACLENISGVGGFSAKGRLPERQAGEKMNSWKTNTREARDKLHSTLRGSILLRCF